MKRKKTVDHQKAKPKDPRLNTSLDQRLEERLSQWPAFRYEVKGDYIGIIDPSGSTYKPIPPTPSPYRTLETYRVARACLLNNLRGPLVTPNEYKKLFEALDLDDLLRQLMSIEGKVRGICVVCYRDLTGKQESCCSERCRNTARQRRRLASGKKAFR